MKKGDRINRLELQRRMQELFAGFDFNTRVKALLDCFPYNYEDRLELVEMPTQSIRYYTPSIEDLIVSKLYAYRPKDIQDLEAIKAGRNYDPELLDKVVLEAKDSAVTKRRYDEMVHLYKRFFKE